MLVLRGVMWSFYFPHGKHICAIWWHGISTNSGDSYGHQLCSTYSIFIFILLRKALYVWPSKVETFWPHRYVQRYLSIYREISFQEYITEGISHPVFYGDLVYKLRRVRCEANFVSSGSKIVKRLRRRKYDPLIIENTIGLVLGPSTALYRSFLEHCTLTNKAVGTIWRDLSKPPQRRQGPDPRPLWLLVGTPLVLGPELASRRAEHSHSGGCHYIFLIYCFLSPYMCNNFMASPLQLAVGPRPSQGGLFTNF